MLKNSMIIEHYSGQYEHFVCPCQDCNADPTKVIPIFYSYKHAIKFGWVATQEEKYCDPQKHAVFVCPECYKKIRKEKLDETS